MNPAALNSSKSDESPPTEKAWHQSLRRVRPGTLPGAIMDYAWREPAPSWVRSCALALACVASTVLLEIAVGAVFGEVAPFLLYLGAVLAAGWYGGFRAALAATFAASLVIHWTVFEPAHPPWNGDRGNVLQFVLFMLEGFLVSWLMRVVQQFRDDRAYSLACQKADKARAEQSEQRLRFALEAARMVAWEWDLASNQIAYSTESATVMGLGPEGQSPQVVAELVHPDDLPELTRAVQSALNGKQEYRAEFRIRQAKGGYMWVQDRGQVRRNPDGKAIRFTGVLLDITHRRQAEEALRSSQEELQSANETLRSILMAFPDVMFVVDMQGNIRMRNVSGEHFLDSLGSTTSLPAPIEAPLRSLLSAPPESIQPPTRQVLEFRIANQDRYYSLCIAPIQSKKGDPLGAAVVLQDVTEFRLLDEIKTNLIATVSHEVKTPLTSVQTALQVLQAQRLGQLNQQQEEMVLIAREEADRLLRTLNSLLDLTRFEEGMTGMRCEEVTCQSLIDDALDESRLAASTANVRVRTHVEADLPVLQADRQRLVHVLLNFLTNAIKYSPQESEILVEARRAEGDQVRLSVLDHGPGIAFEHQHRLFDKFYRVPDNAQNGVGLGLSIAREFIHAHGGAIGVNSQLGHGSEFFFLLRQGSLPTPS